MKRRIPWLAIATIALTILCLAVIILGVCGYIKLDHRVRDLENQTYFPTASDMQATIDFLKDQMQTLIWVLGGIITIAGAILAFLGMHTHKSIKDEYKLTYSKLIAARDSEVFKKRIIFLYQENDDTLGVFQREMRDIGYNIKVLHASSQDTVSKLRDTSNATIVVYRVNGSNDIRYQDVAGDCEEKGVHCILYCPGFYLPKEFVSNMHNYSYVSISQQIAKLRESLYTLLYLAPDRV